MGRSELAVDASDVRLLALQDSEHGRKMDKHKNENRTKGRQMTCTTSGKKLLATRICRAT
jgi:hypothetical protein